MEDNTVLALVSKATKPPILKLKMYCLIKVTTQLLENAELNTLLKQCNCDGEFTEGSKIFQKEEWYKLQTKIVEILECLNVPLTLNPDILEYLCPLATNKLRWMRAYAKNLEWEHLQDFTWTDRGKIDGQKTVQSIIRNSCFSIQKRFEIACLFFLHNESWQLWQEMSRDQRSFFFTEEANSIAKYLLPYIQDGMRTITLELEDIRKNKLPWEAFRGFHLEDERNLIASRYFKFLTDSLCKHKFYEEEITYTCVYILSQVDDTTKAVLITTYPDLLLCCLLDQIKLDEFKNFYQQRANELNLTQISRILMFLFYKFHLGGWDYRKFGLFFKELLKMIPCAYRVYLRRKCYGTYWVCGLIRSHFPMILKAGGHLETQAFISQLEESNPTGRMHQFNQDVYCLLQLIIGASLTTVVDMESCKRAVLKLLGLSETDENEWNGMICFIDQIWRKYSSERETD